MQQVQNNNTEDAMSYHIFFIKFPETDNKIDAQLFRFFTNNLGNENEHLLIHSILRRSTLIGTNAKYFT